MMGNWLRAVRAALDASQGPRRVFFRVDDGGWDHGRLQAVLDVFAAHAVPVDLAIIPAALTADAAHDLRTRRRTAPMAFHQHGYRHISYETTGRKSEFGPARPRGRQYLDIAAGWERLRGLLDGEIEPIFTPPWNRCTGETVRNLEALGFLAVSRDASATPLGATSLCQIPVHVDWSKKRRGVVMPPDTRGARIARTLQNEACVGIMLHHALMDARQIHDLRSLVRLLIEHPHAVVRPMRSLIQPRPASLA